MDLMGTPDSLWSYLGAVALAVAAVMLPYLRLALEWLTKLASRERQREREHRILWDSHLARVEQRKKDKEAG